MDITIVHAFHSHYENLQHANAVLFVFRRCDPHKDFLRISDSGGGNILEEVISLIDLIDLPAGCLHHLCTIDGHGIIVLLWDLKHYTSCTNATLRNLYSLKFPL